MKSFVIALCLFLLLCGLIAANAFYVRRVATHVEEMLASLTLAGSDTEERLSALENYWNRQSPWLALTVGRRDLNRFAELLLSLRAANDTQNAADFEHYRCLASKIAKELATQESFSLENLC